MLARTGTGSAGNPQAASRKPQSGSRRPKGAGRPRDRIAQHGALRERTTSPRIPEPEEHDLETPMPTPIPQQTLTVPAETAAATLHRTHGISATAFTPLGSELASTFRAETGSGRIAVKMQRTDRGVAPIQDWRAGVAERLSELGHPVPETVRARDGGLIGRDHPGDADHGVAVLVTRWIDASPCSRTTPDAALGAEIGRAAARLQRDLGAMDAPPEPIEHDWAAHSAAAALERHLALVDDPRVRDTGAAALALHSERIAPVAAGLPRTLVHQDLHDDNLLVARAADGTLRVAAIIDFDDMLVGWRVAEPAIAAAYLARRLADPLAGLSSVAEAWEAEIPFTDAERTAYAAIAAVRLALNAVVWGSRSSGERGSYAIARSGGSLDAFDRVAASI
ncbi:hypothetical protein D3248_10680 [Leucobacter zeae]|nr:hypothetical protein [Leucobacter zeae]